LGGNNTHTDGAGLLLHSDLPRAVIGMALSVSTQIALCTMLLRWLY